MVFSSGNPQKTFLEAPVSLRDFEEENLGSNYYILWPEDIETATTRSSLSGSKCDK